MVRGISLPEAGKPRAWNVLLQQARKPVVVFADADVLLAPDAVDHLVRAFATRPHLIAVGARPVPVTLGLRPLQRYLARPPTAIGSLGGRLYAVRRPDLMRQMAVLGLPVMPSAVNADDLWVTLVVGRRHWAEAPGAVVYHLPPAASELQETYRRAHRGRRQLKAILPDRFREQLERPGHRHKRWAEGLRSQTGIGAKTRCVLSFLAQSGMRVLARLEIAFESPNQWTSTWRVAKASKDGKMMMAGVRGAVSSPRTFVQGRFASSGTK